MLDLAIVLMATTLALLVVSIRARVPDVDEREVDGITKPEPCQLVWCYRHACREGQPRRLRDLRRHHGPVRVDEQTPRIRFGSEMTRSDRNRGRRVVRVRAG